MLSDTATKNRFEISEISDVDDLIDAMHECAHGIVCGEPVADQNHKMLASLRIGTLSQLRQDWVRLQGCAFEVFVNDNDVVVVSLELEQHVLFEQTEVHFVVHHD